MEIVRTVFLSVICNKILRYLIPIEARNTIEQYERKRTALETLK
jgi:hypothetical protein